VNENIRMNAGITYDSPTYRIILDGWSWTLMECDPTANVMSVSFIDDDGNALRQLNLDLNKADIGAVKSVPSVF
jgi:hypothetical protein